MAGAGGRVKFREAFLCLPNNFSCCIFVLHSS
nr:MAG TPA: hypothetical protein [Caudoviricetes sp.]